MIIEPRKIRQVDYFVVFYYEDGLSGFRFPCNRLGVVSNLSELQSENYERCLSKDLPVSSPFIEEETTTFSVASVIVCDCGQEYFNEDSCPNCFPHYFKIVV